VCEGVGGGVCACVHGCVRACGWMDGWIDGGVAGVAGQVEVRCADKKDGRAWTGRLMVTPCLAVLSPPLAAFSASDDSDV
jgi:hypothetical protein